MHRDITLRTTTGDFKLKSPFFFTIEQVLLANKLPVNLFQGYLKSKKNSNPATISLYSKIEDFPSDSEIIVQCIRNIDFSKVKAQYSEIKEVDNAVTFLRETIFPNPICYDKIIELDAIDCQNIVEERVLEFTKTYSNSDTIIAGISGGGDSNTLVKSLNKIENKNLICYTIIFDPIWHYDAALRAKKLCDTYNAEHIIITPQEIESRFKMKGTLVKFYNEFKKLFGNDTDEFFATFLVAKVGRDLCKQNNTNEFCLGYNREDIFAELLYSVMNGQKPLQIPNRKFDDYSLLMPLWEIPKRILDGCYPEFSSENYDERIELTTNQRHNIYYLSHLIDDAYDNLGFSIMDGLRKIFDENGWANMKFDKTYDLYINQYASNKVSQEFKTIYDKYFVQHR